MTTEQDSLRESARKIQDTLVGFGLDFRVKEFSESTRSAAEAAATIGCTVGQIAKSIVFRGSVSSEPILAILSGAARVDEKKLATAAGEKLEKADADFVRSRLGFVIGGVPPIGHLETPRCFVDRGLLEFSELWAAAGTPHAVFRLTPEELLLITRTEASDFSKS